MLDAQAIDVYIEGSKVVHRNDAKSRYAAGALKTYLEKQELARIADEYEIDRAFPLRIEVNYIENVTITQGTALLDLADVLTDNSLEPAEADSEAADVDAEQATYESDTDFAVREQIRGLEGGNRLAELEMEFMSDKEIIVPSLMSPPIPFAQVIVAFLYVLPVSFVSVFFTSSFMNEKIDRRIVVLMSTPVTPFQIIVGKMLPYMSFALVSVVVITLVLGGNLLLAMAIFTPVILFIFSIYLMVPLVYRTFKDTTFISMLAITVITSYLVFPAMFSGVNDLSLMSPLTLAVKMYRGEPFGLREYLFSTTPMCFIFILSMYVGTRILNEEYLMGFRPLYRKVADAIYLSIVRSHIYVSIALLSLFFIPIVYMIQLVTLALSLNLPLSYAVGGLLMVAVVIEEVAKSAGIAVLLENGVISTTKDILVLSFLSAVGFLIGEKLLLYVSLSVVSESMLSPALFSSGLLLIPLAVHSVSTAIVCLLTGRFGVRYPFAVLAGSIAHTLYNLYVLGVIP
ncbi:MAG: ABC transporter permease [Chloroflexota bacterium]|nr:ABC transporter permease [Chloroflexota bacterium]